jgi:dTDP-4-amino-4,6-dideoxygalactose transaminase
VRATLIRLVSGARGNASRLVKRLRIGERAVGSRLGEDELDAVRRVIDSRGSLSWGEEIGAFEAEFGAYVGAEHAVATSSCTSALRIAAQVLRLGPGDEVVSTPQTFIAGAVALLERGVRVRFADIEPNGLNVDPASVEALLTDRTKAIYLVHHGGIPADLGAIRAFAEPRGIPIVEDCAHAIGAVRDGQRIGTGDICCFSFQSLKNMTTLGEGGMFCTRNAKWAEEARSLRAWGVVGPERDRLARIGPHTPPDFELKDHADGSWDRDLERVEEVGGNLRMSVVEAAVGRVQLKKLEALDAARRNVADQYARGLAQLDGIRPVFVAPGARPSWHLYSVLLDPDRGIDRNALVEHLQERCGVRIVLRYWPLHLHRAFRARGHEYGECPECERTWFARQIDLPIHPDLPRRHVSEILEALASGLDAR